MGEKTKGRKLVLSQTGKKVSSFKRNSEFITNLGKLKIKWVLDDSRIKENLQNYYKDFIVPLNNNYEVLLEVKSKYPQITSKVNFFLKTDAWDYGERNNKRYLHFFHTRNSLMEFSSDFSKIKLWSKEHWRKVFTHLSSDLLYTLLLPQFKGIFLHASAIKINKRIFVCIAPSGGGKSTMAKLALLKNLVVLNDERIILRKVKDKYIVFGNPWHGKMPQTSPEFGEVKEVFFLKKANRNYGRKMNKKEMALRILEDSMYLDEDKKTFKKVFEIAFDAGNNIDAYILGFRPDLDIWGYLDERFKQNS